jgi:hypothetical protein
LRSASRPSRSRPLPEAAPPERRSRRSPRAAGGRHRTGCCGRQDRGVSAHGAPPSKWCLAGDTYLFREGLRVPTCRKRLSLP